MKTLPEGKAGTSQDDSSIRSFISIFQMGLPKSFLCYQVRQSLARVTQYNLMIAVESTVWGYLSVFFSELYFIL